MSVLIGCCLQLCGGKVSEGIFVGVFLSMSSTAVVLKFLMEKNSTNALHGQVTIGTLILQDCAVGLLFALLPVLGGTSGILQGVISMAKLMVTLITFLAVLSISSRTCVPWLLKLMISLSSQTNELYQLASVAFCLLVAWLRVVRAVAVPGGLLQIFLFMCLCGITASMFLILNAAVLIGCCLQLCGGKVSEGIFVGVFLSMSSTAVVLKFLMEKNSTNALHGQVTIGTLILQDCAVGLLFALLPVLGGTSGILQGVISMAKLMVTLITFLAVLSISSRTCVPWLLKLMISLSSQTNELYQLASVAFCLLVAWCSDKLGLSLELGSFAAGVMISTTDLAQHTLEQIEPIRNLFAALFLASIGMLIHVQFLWNHVDILLASVILVIIIKTIIITMVVKGFGYNNKTSFLVGISLAQIGEFAFVLLSRASNLHLVEGKLYLLLLGTTALSLVTTPFLFKLIPGLVHLGVLLRWFPPDGAVEIGFKGDNLRSDSGKRVILMVRESHDS
ncbi:hypothetical protein C1H46_036999 [Malus baccata]|uniref:Cation/H+ exchanger transmembrane domain-containing protein n=1 Tax=Malus baccata TaxID=106549 RepID=A0A540KTX5_MALBA|nr:hypothetical protein C1H46_036999 [Malus baccata]